jgi:hypothetical protein
MGVYKIKIVPRGHKIKLALRLKETESFQLLEISARAGLIDDGHWGIVFIHLFYLLFVYLAFWVFAIRSNFTHESRWLNMPGGLSISSNKFQYEKNRIIS